MPDDPASSGSAVPERAGLLSHRVAREIHQGPLQSIYAAMFMLEMAPEGERTQEVLEVLRDGAQQLSAAIETLDEAVDADGADEDE